MKENTEAPKSTPPKATRTRSPAYPAIDLESALAKAQILWDKANRHLVSLEDAVGYWGYGAKSSSGGSAVAALKKFGLISEETASDGTRMLKLTDTGINLAYPDTTSAEYETDVKKAALAPAIHAELWKKYEGNLPDDKVIERYLQVERKFNSEYVSPFISQFKRTIQFAKLSEGDTVQENESEKPIAQAPKMPVAIAFGTPVFTKKQELQSHGQVVMNPPFAFPLADGIAYLQVPQGMSEQSYDMLIGYITAAKPGLVRKPIAPAIELPARATWRNGDTDKPVKIVALMGERDGEQYYQSEDGTGIPASQLQFSKSIGHMMREGTRK